MEATTVSLERLRASLKTWEKCFADANQGRRAGREDIKKHPSVAQKYKQYAKLRANLSSKTSPPTTSRSPVSPSKKRKLILYADTNAQTIFSNPPKHPGSTNIYHQGTLDPYDSPPSTQTPICHRIAIGPTPQKNGNILGLFDLLSPASALKPVQTPSKSSTTALQNQEKETPSEKVEGVINGHTTATRADHDGSVPSPSRTPKSLSKTMYLSSVLTPSAHRIISQHRTPGCNSKSKTSRKLFTADETPEFLKRNSLRTILPPTDGADDSEITWSPIKVRMPSKPAGKGLSVLVRGLRGIQDEALDEDMEMLREMETKELCTNETANLKPRLLIKDCQTEKEMPLGPDGVSDDGEACSVDDALQKMDGKLNVWRKKGQKRRTKKVKMKPSIASRRLEPAWQDLVEVSQEDHENLAKSTRTDEMDMHKLNAEKDKSGDGNERARVEDLQPFTKSNAQTSIKSSTKPKKKTNPTANANFRALDIKNKQFKGKRRTRFGRRRMS